MRVEDPNGDLVTDERDDRLMRHVKPGERGHWRILGHRGPRRRRRRAGQRGPDRRRRSQPQLALRLATGAGAGGRGAVPAVRARDARDRAVGARAPAHRGRPVVPQRRDDDPASARRSRTDKEAGVAPEDKALYDVLGQRGMVLLPGYRYMQIREELYQVWGGFLDWTAHALGHRVVHERALGAVGLGHLGRRRRPRRRSSGTTSRSTGRASCAGRSSRTRRSARSSSGGGGATRSAARRSTSCPTSACATACSRSSTRARSPTSPCGWTASRRPVAASA